MKYRTFLTVAPALILLGVAWETRDGIAAGVQNLRLVIEGEVAQAGFGISKINLTGQNITAVAMLLHGLLEPIDPQE